MSSVNFLEKLLDGVEVEWKTLGQTCKIETGKLNANAAVDDGKYMFFTTAKETSKIDKFRWDTEALLIAGNANVGEVKHYIGKFEAYQRTYVLTNFDENVSVRFLYFVLSHSLKKYLEERTNSAAMTYIVLSTLENFPIPIPCPGNPQKSLAIQSEIVRILDKFTALTAELTAELNMRKKQYNYYRDQLLTFKEGEVEWKALGEIGEVRMCKRILKSQTSSEGEIPFYKIGTFGKEPDSYISRKLFNEFKEKYSYPKVGEVLISASGTIGRTVIFDGRESYFQDSNIVWIENNEKIVLNKYLFYFYKIAKWGISEGGTIKRLYNDNLRKLMIPVPFPDSPERSLVEQQKIVKLLDKFDALTNSITEGLPREIELRQKQYEYYRDLLFSFPKPDTVSN
ncbi:restriction endonuclease subunit S [Escherichia coli]|uniref:restriction endonuclease subunit S n=1 Tax=Escherichia coli TaxID=562 RepID=UPI000667C79F|nr:restriction endonuclease subunit S [Escherichia coli]EFA4822415.1 restriction endonuclease subunit S [Escherichia coli]EFH6538166.1 restriction endonuclease subunit S [Escherichia coli]EFM2092826.1 restriction endonuclease subunit S [Escherichia coli]EFO0311544.1 restriction endonuclease subunit S [Escherichia coli]EGJ6533184.1 restriction endonuclease subunit S [Escherichia coli]